MQLAKDLTSLSAIRAVIKQREKERNHLNEFTKRVFSIVSPGSAYSHNWHIDCVSEYCEAVAVHGQIQNLVINIPPRMMKSIMVSIALPAWLFGRDPADSVVAASGVRPLATRFNDQTRIVMRSDWYKSLFPNTRVRAGQDEKMRFETTGGGYRISVSVGSSVIGDGGRLQIIDDPIDPKKVLSVTELTKCNNWYGDSWYTRSNDPENVLNILVMQRLHRNDMTQHVLNLGGWYHLKLPQEAPKSVVVKFPISKRKVKRKKGDFLHPDRFNVKAKAGSYAALGEYGYASQQQQEPVAKGGNRIKMHWFRRHGALPLSYDESVLSLDTANKGDDINNPTVCGAFVRKETQWYLAKVVRERLVYPDLKRLLLAMEAEWSPNTILIEDKASGQQLLQEAIGLSIHNCVPIEPCGDKIARMEMELAAVEGGLISLPDPVLVRESGSGLDYSWLADWEGEIMEFPMNVDFDQIDMLSQFLKCIRENKATGPLLW